MATRGNVGAFLRRLADLVEGDEHPVEYQIADDKVHVIDDDGLVTTIETGAEAILILRGPVEGRKEAIGKLLATRD